uniref:hypothetical protein n=1 Tax=uncultured Draconibacterium sp. TaxID=1573823 RepID=UPI0032170305
MRKAIFILVVFMLCIGFEFKSEAQTNNKKLEEFVIDLSSANNKLRGKLKLIGEYKGDLSALTFNHYIKLLTQNEVYSNKGISAIIEEAEDHLFVAEKKTFHIVIYSKKLNAVLYDNANTAEIDSVIVLQKNQNIPELKDLIE